MQTQLLNVRTSLDALKILLQEGPRLTDEDRALLNAAEERHTSEFLAKCRQARQPSPDADGWEF